MGRGRAAVIVVVILLASVGGAAVIIWQAKSHGVPNAADVARRLGRDTARGHDDRGPVLPGRRPLTPERRTRRCS